MKKITLNTYLIIILFLIFPFGQLTAISLFNQNIRFYIHDLIIFIFINLNYKNILSCFKRYKYFSGFIIIGTIGLIVNLQQFSVLQTLIASLYLFRFIFYTLFGLIIYSNKNINWKIIKKTFYITIITSLILGFGQYLLFPKFESIFYLGWDRHAYRLTGGWLDPGFSGMIFLMMLIWINKKITTKVELIDLMLAILLIGSILLTYSRTTYLALICIMFIRFFNKYKKLLMFTILGFILLILILPKRNGEGTKLFRTSTINSRINNWHEGINYFSKSPIIGYGFNNIINIKDKSSYRSDHLFKSNIIKKNNSASAFDNSLITLITTTGLLGLIFYILFWKSVLINNYNIFVYSIISALSIHGMFTNTWFYPWIYLLFWIMITPKFNDNI